MKRAFDIIGACFGFLLLSPFFILIALLIKWDSKGPVLFKQERLGRQFRPFIIYKFRTMRQSSDHEGRLVTAGNDPRITRIGSILRQTKMDETPQLLNVLKGDMSFVGPRPEVRRFVEQFRADYQEILKVRPGITDLASLKYRDEASLLGRAIDPDAEYINRVLPDKIKLAKEYIRLSSFVFDLKLIIRTLLKVFDYKMSA